MFQHLAHFLCALSELFLKFANQLVILAFSVGKIVVGQLSVLLFELALDFVPGTFELQLVRTRYSLVKRPLVIPSLTRRRTPMFSAYQLRSFGLNRYQLFANERPAQADSSSIPKNKSFQYRRLSNFTVDVGQSNKQGFFNPKIKTPSVESKQRYDHF
jgi:hypothetical protein